MTRKSPGDIADALLLSLSFLWKFHFIASPYTEGVFQTTEARSRFWNPDKRPVIDKLGVWQTATLKFHCVYCLVLITHLSVKLHDKRTTVNPASGSMRNTQCSNTDRPSSLQLQFAWLEALVNCLAASKSSTMDNGVQSVTISGTWPTRWWSVDSWASPEPWQLTFPSDQALGRSGWTRWSAILVFTVIWANVRKTIGECMTVIMVKTLEWFARQVMLVPCRKDVFILCVSWDLDKPLCLV